MKTCSKCGAQFNTKAAYCSPCNRAYQRKHYQQNKAVYVEKARVYRRRVREFIKRVKRRACCIQCGESHPACLVFHHRDSEDKSFGINANDPRVSSIAQVKREMRKCDLLCANCHRKLHWEQRTTGV